MCPLINSLTNHEGSKTYNWLQGESKEWTRIEAIRNVEINLLIDARLTASFTGWKSTACPPEKIHFSLSGQECFASLLCVFYNLYLQNSSVKNNERHRPP